MTKSNKKVTKKEETQTYVINLKRFSTLPDSNKFEKLDKITKNLNKFIIENQYNTPSLKILRKGLINISESEEINNNNIKNILNSAKNKIDEYLPNPSTSNIDTAKVSNKEDLINSL